MQHLWAETNLQQCWEPPSESLHFPGWVILHKILIHAVYGCSLWKQFIRKVHINRYHFMQAACNCYGKKPDTLAETEDVVHYLRLFLRESSKASVYLPILSLETTGLQSIKSSMDDKHVWSTGIWYALMSLNWFLMLGEHPANPAFTFVSLGMSAGVFISAAHNTHTKL